MVVLLGLGLLGGFATVLAADRSLSSVAQADAEVAGTVADSVRSTLTSSMASLAGADVMAVDGEVSAVEFRSFGADVVGSGLAAVAYSEPVPESDRARWEAESGLQIVDIEPGGGRATAAARDRHVVIRLVVPDSAENKALLGFDLLGDELRAKGVVEADKSTATIIVGPIRVARTGNAGVFEIRAVRDAEGTPIGFVSSGLAFDTILSQAGQVPANVDLGVAVDGVEVLSGGGRGRASFELGGRVFTVRASSRSRLSWLTPAALGIGTVALVGLALVAAQGERKDRLLRDRGQGRSAQLGLLAEELATAPTTSSVIRAVANRSSEVLDASHTNVGIRSASDESKLHVIHDDGMASALSEQFAVQDLDASLPLTDCARSGAMLVVPDRGTYQRLYPHVMTEIVQAGIHAVLCVPLGLGNDGSVGVIGFAFDRPLGKREQRELQVAAELVSQMTGRAFERAVVRERVDLLSEFTRALTSARSVDDVSSAVADQLPPVLDVIEARLSPTAPPEEPTTHTYPPPTPDGDYLVLRRRGDRNWTTTDETMTLTVVDLIEAALARTRLHDQERAILQQFQLTFLTPPPPIDGFDVAVNYHSALIAYDMGGDWYSIIDSNDFFYAVIGDVAGHGPEAVAIMAEVKSILRHQLTNGTPIEHALSHADGILARRRSYASAIIAQIDKINGELRYVNAGHPPPLLCNQGGMWGRYDGVHQPWLGVRSSKAVTPTTLRLDRGDQLLMYTDGLIEQRGEPLTVSIDRLATEIDRSWSPDEIVRQLVSHRLQQGPDRTVDDDIAIIAIRRTDL